ncbi:MAG TPA: zinc ribbon domain-containing protein [Clostridiaceae bacterium]|nr:zinc ribbon domain-containing protein [Clostridiaceae bacterium]
MSFFDNLSKKVSNTAKSAAKKSSNLVEIAKLNMNISSEEDKINKLYAEIGKIAYSSYSAGKEVPEEYKTQCESIKTCLDNIKNFKKQIMALKQIKECPSCGNELEIDAVFCSKCGAKQEIIKPENSEAKESDKNDTAEECDKCEDTQEEKSDNEQDDESETEVE